MTPRQAGLLGGLALVWGSSYLLIKYALESFSPGEIVFLRCAVAAVTLALVIRLQDGAARAALSRTWELRRRVILLGLVQIGCPFLLISFGELEISSGLTGVLLAPTPLFVALLALVLDRSERVSRAQAVGLVAGIGGVALVVGVEAISTLGEFLGAMAVIGASFGYALGSFIVKRWFADIPSEATSLGAVATAAVITLPIAAATMTGEVPGGRAIAAIVVLGVVGTALAFVIMYRLIAEIGAGRANLVSYLIPPVSLAYGVLLLGESFTVAAFAGLALILAGVAVASRPRPAEIEVADIPVIPPGAEAGVAVSRRGSAGPPPS